MYLLVVTPKMEQNLTINLVTMVIYNICIIFVKYLYNIWIIINLAILYNFTHSMIWMTEHIYYTKIIYIYIYM